ncbi:hypothetical protein [Streptomyces sp. NPDC051561]|uniref:hypothetical protein n=1 Tax=Streptomyces sp. NPDC051561 TaxID=3365658 RepID=UPI0037B439E3
MNTPGPDHARTHARNAADAIQQLNHRTFGREALPNPPQVSEVTQFLSKLADRLPQALDQLSTAVRRHLAEDLIRMDDGTDAGPAADDVLHHLGQAGLHARTLSDSLHKAASPLFHMGTKETSA